MFCPRLMIALAPKIRKRRLTMENKEGSVEDTEIRGSHGAESASAVQQQPDEELIFHEENIDLGEDEFESQQMSRLWKIPVTS
ncbi:hypothetical protein JRQ81_007050 [Phrynocephalus forsythii]|uniref:Uncharacterized protein n=1 Tax=Phrynocephalus forsythii TaxID=171643 RepID=A0A9Q0Y6B0_9SAUR|nr:hypothetical protein JRQ81_007050 [Phrynocephalus forsythii]